MPADLREAAIEQSSFLFKRRDDIGLAGIGFDGAGMRELRIAGLTDDSLRGVVRETILETPDGALGTAIRGMKTANGGNYLDDLRGGTGYFARVKESLSTSAESGLDVFGAAPARPVTAGRAAEGLTPLESGRAKFRDWNAQATAQTPRVNALRAADRGGRTAAYDAQVKRLVDGGMPRPQAMDESMSLLSGKMDKLELPGLNLTPDEVTAFWDRLPDFKTYEQVNAKSAFKKLWNNITGQGDLGDTVHLAPNERILLRRVWGEDVLTSMERMVDENIVSGQTLPGVEDIVGVPAQPRVTLVDPPRPHQIGETPGSPRAGGLGPDVGSAVVDVPGQRRVLTDPELPNPVSEEARATEAALSESLKRGVDPFDPQGRVPLADVQSPARAPRPSDEFPQQAVTDAKGRPLAQPQSPMRRFVDAFKIIQTAQQSFDLSFHFNQGAKLGWRHPRAWSKSFWRGIRAARSEDASAYLDAQMRGLGDASDDIGKKAQTEVLLTTPDGPKRVIYGEVADKWMRMIRGVEEDDFWMSRTAEKIPGVKPSENAFTTSGNSLRFDVGYQMLNRITKGFTLGITETQVGEIGRALQRLSGRGNLDMLGGYKPAIQAIFRAPGYRISSPQSLMLLGSTSRQVRNLAWQSLASWGVATGSAMMLMDQAGGKLDMNPNSSEFGRVQFGNTSYHLWGADQTLARSAMQIIMQSAQSREVTLPDGTKTAAKWDTDWKRVLGNYGWSGIDPALGVSKSFIDGENYVGEPVNFTTFEGLFNAVKDVMPLSLQDAWDAYQSDGVFQALITAIFAGTGGRTTSYKQESNDIVDLMRKYTTISEETERLLRPFQEDVDVAWGSAKQNWFQTLGITEAPWPMTKWEVAIDFGNKQGTPNLGQHAAAAIRGTLGIRADFVEYIKEHQDELGADTLGYALPDSIALAELTEANYDRYTQFNARER